MIRRCYLIFAKVCLFVIEGPSRPWWASRGVMLLGVGIIGLGAAFESRWLVFLGLALIVMGVIWTKVRNAQIVAVATIATASLDKCPFCKYSLAGVTEDKCPECGRKPKADTERLRSVMGIQDAASKH